MEIQPENPALHWALAKAYARAGDEAASASERAEALALDPNIASKEDENELAKLASVSAHRYDRFKATVRLALGLIWDSNATGGLDNL